MKKVSFLEILVKGLSHSLLACAIVVWATHASSYHKLVNALDFWASRGFFVLLLLGLFMAYWGISYLRNRKAEKPSQYNKYFVTAYLVSSLLILWKAYPEMSYLSLIGKAILGSLALSAILAGWDYKNGQSWSLVEEKSGLNED